MISKKALAQALEKQSKQIELLVQQLGEIQNIAGDSGSNDAELQFSTNKMISARNYIESVTNSANPLRSGVSDDTDTSDIEAQIQFWNYKLINDESFDKEVWWEAHRFIDKWFALTNLGFDDEYTRRIIRDYVFRVVFLFGKPVGLWVDEKDGSLRFSWVIKETLKTVELQDINITWGESVVEPKINGNVFKKAKEEVAILNIWWDELGFWIKSIPYLCRLIYHKRIRDKNCSFLQTIADTSGSGRSKTSWITKFNIFRWRDKSADNQDKKFSQQNAIGDRIHWYSAGDDVRKTFDMLNIIIDKDIEELNAKFGFDTTSMGGSAVLSTQSALQSSDYSYTQKNMLDAIYNFAFQLKTKLGVNVEFQDVEMEQMGNGNTNAVKQDTQQEIDNGSVGGGK